MRYLAALSLAVVTACGGAPPIPQRGVVEGDVGPWRFRRFQSVLDVEVWVENNRAQGYTATYVRDEAERKGRITDGDLVTAFVTRYQSDIGIVREAVRFFRRLAQKSGYQVEEMELGDDRAILISGRGEAWVMWASPHHVIKIGGRGRSEVPDTLIDHYEERFPSTLPGGMMEGPLPDGGPSKPAKSRPGYDPNSPAPDWETYDPDKVNPTASQPPVKPVEAKPKPQ